MRKVCEANERSEASVSAISTNRKTSVFAEVFSLYKRESYKRKSYKRESKSHCPSFAEQKREKLGFVEQTHSISCVGVGVLDDPL